MKIGLIDVDGHNFPNLALMRISQYHKLRGDTVEWWWSDFIHYDIVYMSKVFSDDYSRNIPRPMNADMVIQGGTGYAISIDATGKEVFQRDIHQNMPAAIEGMFPDYSIYPEHKFAVCMTSRGCGNGCPWCHVGAKEGCKTVKVADVSDFYTGQKEIQVLDPNITACPEKRELFQQYIDTGALINFSQGLDIRLIDDNDMADINAMRIKGIHFAWDNPKVDLSGKFEYYKKNARHKPHGKYGMVYVLTNFNSTMEENLHRIYTLRDLGFDPYVMIYDKPHAPREVRLLQRWCNNKIIFNSTKRFEEFDGKK